MLLEREAGKWESKPWGAIIAELQEVQAYRVGAESALQDYQIEVELLEVTEDYVQVMIAIDDGTLSGGLRPLTRTLIIRKHKEMH